MQFKQTLAVTADGDIALDNQNRAYAVDGVQGVAQELKILLSTIRGEDWFEPEHGLRIFEVASAPEEVLEREIRFALTDDDRVAAVREIDIEQPVDGARNREVSVIVELVESDVVDIEVSL